MGFDWDLIAWAGGRDAWDDGWLDEVLERDGIILGLWIGMFFNDKILLVNFLSYLNRPS